MWCGGGGGGGGGRQREGAGNEHLLGTASYSTDYTTLARSTKLGSGP